MFEFADRVLDLGVTVSCGSGSEFASAGEDGVVTLGGGRATLLAPNGQVPAGWPVVLPYTLASACLWCTPGPAGPVAPAVGARGIWVAAYDGNPRGDALPGAQPRIIGIDREGALPESWQHAIGTGGDELEWVRISPTGGVWAGLRLQAGGASLHLVAEDSVPGQ